MAGSVSEDIGTGRSLEGFSGGQRCQSGESMSEWRSCEQVENGTPSTSPYYDTDDNDGGAKPSELFGKFTWKIENFSHVSVNKRELKSNIFEAGGYKWYILIYPQGCDVCNHLSLFLCVANHDKLLPGWSHFAQFTIAVVNNDPKKSKYSDTLHRFWKKEHDWGWKKFMELSKVQDGFIVSDTLVIKAQVQVIREKSNRPFRCLDCQYRRELVSVYLSNVELICRRFVEEKRGVLGKLINDEVRWSSFRAFWYGVDQNARRHMSRDKQESILKDVVKSFFIEKEVTSTLVMDSLYSGLRAMECQNKNKKLTTKLVEMEETSAPFVLVEKDMFVLADDVLELLERAAKDSLPAKDEKSPQNRTKEASSGDEFNKDSIERDERRLTELGRRTVEVFVLAHIFSKIEAAYQEAVAYQRQEELIREEAERELKSKRGAIEKEKRTKKKQSKQKKSSRKGKDRSKYEKFDVISHEKNQGGSSSSEITLIDFSLKQGQTVFQKPIAAEDVSDVSDTGDGDAETLQCDLEDCDDVLVVWDSNTPEVPLSMEMKDNRSSLRVQNDAIEKKSPVLDDSSSTCSTDSAPAATNGRYRGNSLPNQQNQTSPSRGKKLHKQDSRDWNGQGDERDNVQLDYTADVCHLPDSASCCIGNTSESDYSTIVKDQKNGLDQNHIEKAELNVLMQRKLSVKNQDDATKTLKKRPVEAYFLPSTPVTTSSSSFLPKQAGIGNKGAAVSIRDSSSNDPRQTEKFVQVVSRSLPAIPEPEVQKAAATLHASLEQQAIQQSMMTSRPLSAPPVSAPVPNASVASVVQSSPSLSRSVSAAGRLGLDSSLSGQGYYASYRNAITGKDVAATPANFMPHPSSSFSAPTSYSENHSGMGSLPFHSAPVSMREDQTAFGSIALAGLQNQSQQFDYASQEENGVMACSPYYFEGLHGLDIRGSSPGQRMLFADEQADMQPRHIQGPNDDFPHIDIIDYLFDEEQGGGKAGRVHGASHGPNNRSHLCRQSTFPGESGMADVGCSPNCCRFDQLGRHPVDRIIRTHSSSDGLYEGLRDTDLQIGLSVYADDLQTDSMIQNQWRTHVHDLPLFGARNADPDGRQHPQINYTNSSPGTNGYSYCRPPSGR